MVRFFKKGSWVVEDFILSKISLATIIILLAILSICDVHAQNTFLPQNLGENVNTAEGEINPVLSPDGKTLYFTKIIAPENLGQWEKQEIWYSELQPDGNWGKAVPMPEYVNIARYNAVLSTSGDGQTLLLNGVYNKKGTMWKKRGLSTIRKEETGWGIPVKLKVIKLAKKNKGLSSNAFMSYDGNYLVMAFSKRYNRKNLNLWVSKNKGRKWSKPKKLGSTINTRFSEEAPFISNTNEVLYFTRRVKGSRDNYDIYVSNRLDKTWKNWSTPKRLSDTINSVKWESYFKTNVSGSMAYFASENNSLGGPDIFKVKLFEENPFVMVEGIVMNKSTNKPISSKYTFKIMIDGMVVDSVKIKQDSAKYSVKLPYGKKYTIAANVPNFISQTEALDFTQIKEFTKVNKNLYVKAQPYVLLSGKVMLKGTNDPIPAEAMPRIMVDGEPVDSIKVDPATGAYSMNLLYGKKYRLQAAAIKYEPVTEALDLSDVDEYKEINLNLYAEFVRERVATITGVIYDKKTTKPVSSNLPVKVIINGQEAGNAQIDLTRGTYTVEVPLGATYTLNATAPNYYPVYETVDLKNETEGIRVMKDLNIVPIEVGQSVRLNNIFFATGKATLKKESFPELDRVAKFLRDNSNIKVEIAGHTDNVGNAASNLQLSNARAKSVATYIVSKGVDQSQISSKGYGLTKPVADNKTALGKSLNRRVEFTILDK